MISIWMLTFFGDTVLPPLELIFKSYFESGTFASEYIKANLIPVHKKDDKQTLKNYRPISLLPLCGKYLNWHTTKYLSALLKTIISHHQAGLKPGDLYVNKLLFITHEIYKSFDEDCETRGLFLDVSRAFDKVQHKGLLRKLKKNGISGNLLNLVTDVFY